MRIIPAIDIIDGKCVRLSKGDYSTAKIYAEDPLEMAKEIEGSGLKYLHLVDLDGAKAKMIVNLKVLESLATTTTLHIDFGGGIKSTQDVENAFNAGAKAITGGSIAVNNRDLFLVWLEKYGAEKIILGADCRNGMIATHGWTEDSVLPVMNFVSEYEKLGIKNVICTDISKDGMLQGPSIELYTNLIAQTAINLIASGGVSSLADLLELKKIGCEAAIVGKAIYEGKVTLKELAELC